MSYLENLGFKNDVFVSYSHADNTPLFGQDKGWVSNFIDDLEKYLARKLGTRDGQAPFVWTDHELALNVPLDDALLQEIKDTAVYLVIMSPAYLQSNWCKEERKQFLQILNNQSSTSRVFILEIDELDRKTYPADIDEHIIPYRFWYKEKGSKARTLGLPHRDNDEYYNRLIDISANMAEELLKIKTAPTRIVEPVAKANVFLAQVTDDLDEKREEVKRYLKDAGYRVLPEENWYMLDDPQKVSASISKELAHCALYVQLLSNLPGKKIANGNDYLTKFQFDIAQSALKKTMIWRAPELNLDSVTQNDLKHILESEFVRAECLEEFKAAIHSTLTMPPPVLPELDRINDSKYVYICTDPVDWNYCEEVLITEIKRRRNIDYALPLKSQDHVKVRKYQEQNFLACDAAVFVYCNSDPSIVLNQILHCRKLVIKRERPFDIIAIFDGPPEKEEIELGLQNLQFSYLNCRKDIKEFIDKFLNILNN